VLAPLAPVVGGYRAIARSTWTPRPPPGKDGVVTTDTQHPVRVVQLGGLMPFVREWLSERYAAPLREDLGDPAGVSVAVVGGGARAGAEEMDALPDLRAIVDTGCPRRQSPIPTPHLPVRIRLAPVTAPSTPWMG